MPDSIPGRGGARVVGGATSIKLGARPGGGPVRTGWGAPTGSGVGATTELDDLADVDTAGEASNDLLGFDGTQWVPRPATCTVQVPQPLTVIQLSHGLGRNPVGCRAIDAAGIAWDISDFTCPVAGVVELHVDVPFSGAVELF